MVRKKTVLILLCLMTALYPSCATTTGPNVSSPELQAKKRELEEKAAAFKIAQRNRIEAIAKRIIEFMPEEDRAKLQSIEYEATDALDINAAATNSKIMVSYGMLRFTESDDELGVVLAHELAHIAKGHYGKKVATTVVATTVGVAAGAAIESMTGGGLGHVVASGVSKGIAGGFSRDWEREADYFGFQYAYLAGFDLPSGIKIWERLAIEVPNSMTSNIFSTHPSSPERLIRAEKTIEELNALGIQPNVFVRPSQMTVPGAAPQGVLSKTMSASARTLTAPVGAVTGAVTRPMAFTQGAGQNQQQPAVDPADKAPEELTEADKEVLALRAELEQLKKAEKERRERSEEDAYKAAEEKAEMERILLEAKEAAKALRYAEFGVLDMGLAKKVTNLWVGKKVTGEQLLFPLTQGSLDWFVQYEQWSSNSWKALGLNHRKYRAYWYAPNGRLFSEQDFMQSKIRAEFAKTTLKWDPELGKFLTGKWLMRVFEDGKLLDERTFEIIANQ